MFGWTLLRDTEISLQRELMDQRLAALAAELAASKDYAMKCEALIAHERERIDQERERADRIADSLFQSNGLPATSPTVIAEQKAAEATAAGKRTDYMAELMEIYGEMESELAEDDADTLLAPTAESN
jgi:hypothetical protein